MHEVQKILLKRLSQQNDQRYSTLTRDYDYEDNIVFHLKKLITDGFVIKDKYFNRQIIMLNGCKFL